MQEDLKYRISLDDYFTKGITGAKAEADKFEQSIANVQSSAMSMGRALGIAFGAYELVSFSKDIISVTTEYENFTNVMKYSSINSKDAAENINYIEDAVKRLHLPMREAYKSFSEMQAGFFGTGIEGEKLRKIFEGISTASSVLHLPEAQFSRLGFALKEIGELGTLQARQMRMLAFSLPGANEIAHRAMGMNSAQFHEAMKRGQIKASDFLPKFAEAAREKFAPGLPNAGDSLQAHANDLVTAYDKLKLAIGHTLESSIKSGYSSLISLIHGLMEVGHWVKENAGLIKSFAAGLTALATIYTVHIGLLKLEAWWQGFSRTAVIANAFAHEGLAAAMRAVNEIMMENPWMVAAVAIGVAVTAMYHFREETEKTQAALEALQTSQEEASWIKEEEASIKSLTKAYMDLHGGREDVVKQRVIADEISKNDTSKFAKLTISDEDMGSFLDVSKRKTTALAKYLAGLKTDLDKQGAAGVGDLGSGLSEAKASKIQNITINIDSISQDVKLYPQKSEDSIPNFMGKLSEALNSIIVDAAVLATE